LCRRIIQYSIICPGIIGEKLPGTSSASVSFTQQDTYTCRAPFLGQSLPLAGSEYQASEMLSRKMITGCFWKLEPIKSNHSPRYRPIFISPSLAFLLRAPLGSVFGFTCPHSRVIFSLFTQTLVICPRYPILPIFYFRPFIARDEARYRLVFHSPDRREPLAFMTTYF
jgi:hypothetical protein